MELTNLPPDIAAGIREYEENISSGRITFDGEFAHKPDDMPDLEMRFFADKLPAMDIS